MTTRFTRSGKTITEHSLETTTWAFLTEGWAERWFSVLTQHSGKTRAHMAEAMNRKKGAKWL